MLQPKRETILLFYFQKKYFASLTLSVTLASCRVHMQTNDTTNKKSVFRMLERKSYRYALPIQNIIGKQLTKKKANKPQLSMWN
jgi:hypothetical protein